MTYIRNVYNVLINFLMQNHIGLKLA